MSGQPLERMEVVAWNLEDPGQLSGFLQPASHIIPVPFTDKTVSYDPSKRTGVGISRLGTSKAVSVGAYAYALKRLDG